jgi:tetratricopeptide (TPR) repeat protein
MTKTSLQSLDPRVQKQFAAAEQNLKTNPQYAMELAAGLLSRNPGCVDIRRLLRKTQKAVLGTGSGGLGGMLSGLIGGPNLKLAESDPVAAMAEAETRLAKRPSDIGAHRQLAAAAAKLALWDTAAFAHEEIATLQPKDVGPCVAAANAHIEDGEFDKAVAYIESKLAVFPGNGDLMESMRSASVAKTMRKGNWETGDDFRSKLKDSDEATRLEQASRVMTDAVSAQEVIADLAAKIAADTENLTLYREIVRQFTAIGDNESALAWLQRARETALGKGDISLERQEQDLSLRLLGSRIKAARDAGDTAGADALAQEESDYRLAAATAMVERYPNDYAYRHELGLLLLGRNRLDEAIQQLQIAQRNPKLRQSALLGLGKAFLAGRKFDLAVEQLQLAKSELLVMNDLRKEVIYTLGGAFESAGKAKEAIDEYKLIYTADSSYRDVSARINAFYDKPGA